MAKKPGIFRDFSTFQKRSLRLIYPKFQLKLIAYQFLSTALVLGIVEWQNHRSFAQLKQIGDQIQLPANHPYFQFLQYQNSLFQSYLLVAFLVGVVVSTAVTLYLSHKLAGPIVRLKGHLNTIIKNPELPIHPLSFRKGDFFEDLPAKFNEAFETIQR